MGTRGLDALTSVVKDQGGFDVADAMVAGWVNEVHKEAVAASRWLTARVDLGPTVVDQATYALDDNIVAVESLRVGTSSPYTLVGTSDLDAVEGGDATVVDGPVFAEDFDSSGNRLIRLYPPPTEAGLPITARVALVPADLTGTQTTLVPDDVDGRITDGAIAMGLQRIDERSDQAQVFDAKLSEVVQALRMRKRSQFAGEGGRIQIQGVDFV